MYSEWSKREKTESSGGISYSNPLNDHDCQKQKHPAQESAKAEVGP
jgi:hypothetical protein